MTTEQTMPEQLASIYEPIYYEVQMLHFKWHIFCQLYEAGQEILELLMRTASSFFAINQHALFTEMLLGIARLDDPREQTGRLNLSLEQLKHSIELHASHLASSFQQPYDQAKAHLSFTKGLRNRHLAHNDLKTYQNLEPLPPLERRHIEDALSHLKAALTVIHLHYMGEEVYFEGSAIFGGAEELLKHLRENDPVLRRRARHKKIDVDDE